MASGLYDPNVIAPVTSNITVGTTAVVLKGSSSLASRFVITNPNASNAIYVGDSNVTASRFMKKVAAGSSQDFEQQKFWQNQTVQYDLNRFYVIATSATQVATLITYNKGPTGGPF